MPWRRRTDRLLAIALAVAGLIATAPVPALEASIASGASVTASNEHWTPTVFLDVHGERRQSGRWTWQPTLSLGWFDARSARADLDREVAVAGAGVRLVDWWRHAFAAFQIGYAHDTTAALSSHGQFITTVGWQGEHAVFSLRHVSNGNVFGGRNLGETLLLAGLRF